MSIKLAYDRQADARERRRLHQVFNQWLSKANEDDYHELDAVREHFAPNEVCSVVRLLRGCLADPGLMARLPPSLRSLLEQAMNLPPASSDVKAL